MTVWTYSEAAGLMLGRQAAPRAWMTAAQFDQWRQTHFPVYSRGDTMDAAVGITKPMARDRARGVTPVSKVEALACAHLALGMAPPVPAGDVEAFGRWFGETFGAGRQVGIWLELQDDFISSRVRGFMTREGERHERLPGIGLIRALAWIDRVGPFVPWPVE